MAEHNLLGNKGEMLAARYLMEQGFAIREYNWRSGHKEIDLVAQERDVLVFVEVKSRASEEYVFVEVKTRSSEAFGDARNAVTPFKQRNLVLAAEAYVRAKKIDLETRFDVVTVVGTDDTHKIEHIRDAFYPQLL